MWTAEVSGEDGSWVSTWWCDSWQVSEAVKGGGQTCLIFPLCCFLMFSSLGFTHFECLTFGNFLFPGLETSRRPAWIFSSCWSKRTVDWGCTSWIVRRRSRKPEKQRRSSTGSAGLMGFGPLWLVGPCGNFQGSIGFACRSYSRSV